MISLIILIVILLGLLVVQLLIEKKAIFTIKRDNTVERNDSLYYFTYFLLLILIFSISDLIRDFFEMGAKGSFLSLNELIILAATLIIFALASVLSIIIANRLIKII